jgi:AraC-like DNA-binding protein
MRAASELGSFFDRCQVVVLSIDDTDTRRFSELLNGLIASAPTETTCLERIVIRGMLGEILDQFEKKVAAGASGQTNSHSQLQIGWCPWVWRALNFVTARHQDCDFDLTHAAQHVHLSRWHLSRLMRRETGFTFSEHLRRIRTEHARQLLECSLLSIKEIAAAVGYHTTHDLIRNYKVVHGVTPREYRRRVIVSATSAEELRPDSTQVRP